MSPTPAADDAASSDASLLAAHVAGDTDALAILLRRHRDRLWAVALRTMGNHEDAADALQDALIAAYRRADSFRGDAAVTTWLHRIVVNACLDRLRADKVRRTEALPDDLDDYAGRGALVTSTASQDEGDPADLTVRAEQRRAVLAALAALPEEQRVALVLVDLEGYPVAEAAAILECPEGTVKSRCARGRTRLATTLGLPDQPGGNRTSDPAVPSGTPSAPETPGRPEEPA